MNTPTGSFNIAKYMSTGAITGVNPLKVFYEPSTGPQLFHMFMAMYFAGSMALLAYFAYKYLKSKNEEEKKIDRSAMKVLSAVGIVDIILIGISGSIELSTLLTLEPLKYAMMELNMHPVMSGAPEHLFGFLSNGKPVDFIPLAGIQSLLAYPFTKGNAGYIPGLSSYPAYTWAPSVIHITLDLMVGFGVLMGLFWFIVLVLKVMKKDIFNMKWILYSFIGMGFLGMFTMEDGWYTAEVGRVPYIILMPYNSAGQPIIAGHYGVMTIAEAASTSTIVWYLGVIIILFYAIIIPFTFYFNAKVLNLSNVEEDLRKAEKDLNINSSGKDINSVNAGAR